MDNLPTLSVDLLAAADRSDNFPQEWTDVRRRLALGRYRRFLLLAASHRGTPLAPTRDIDEMWHLHMLSPRAYQRDCIELLGEVLDHDGGYGKSPEEVPLLERTFARTADLWFEAFGEAYATDEHGRPTKCWHDCQSRCWHACKSAS